MRILFLSRWYPCPPNNGSKIRIFNLLRQLASSHELHLLTFAEPTDSLGDGADELDRLCRSVRVVPCPRFRPTSATALAALFSPEPRYLADTYSAEFATALREHLVRYPSDLVIASQFAMMPYALQAKEQRLLLEELELGMFRDAARAPVRALASLRPRLTWFKLARYLRSALPAFQACTVASPVEQQHCADLMATYRNVHVIPNSIDADIYVGDYGPPEPDSLVFAGALTYDANLRGAEWLLRHVYPRVQKRRPLARLRITGRVDGVDIGRLPLTSGCELTGHVPDIRPLIARSTVSVVPVLKGGGTRLKILESMALGTPVVSTTKGAEGLDVTHGHDILIADTPAEFAGHVEAVISSPTLRTRLAHGGRELVRSRYEWKVVGPDFMSIVELAAGGRRMVASGGLG